jgi:hypothetical protein
MELRMELLKQEIAGEEHILALIKEKKRLLNERIKIKYALVIINHLPRAREKIQISESFFFFDFLTSTIRDAQFKMWKEAKASNKSLVDLLDFQPGDQLLCLSTLPYSSARPPTPGLYSSALYASLFPNNAKSTNYAPHDPPTPEVSEPTDRKAKKRKRSRPINSEPSSSSSMDSSEEEYAWSPEMPQFLKDELLVVDDLHKEIYQLEQQRKDLINAPHINSDIPTDATADLKQDKPSPNSLPCSPKKPKKQNTGAGLKVFFGGISFSDIRARGVDSSLPASTSPSTSPSPFGITYRSEEGIWSQYKVDKIIKERTENFKVCDLNPLRQIRLKVPAFRFPLSVSRFPFPIPVPFPVSHFPFPISRFPFPVSRFPFPVSRFPFPVSRFPFPVSRFPVPVSRFPFPVSRFPFPVSRFPFPVSRFPFPVSRFPFPVSRFPFPFSRFLFPVSRFLFPVSRFSVSRFRFLV